MTTEAAALLFADRRRKTASPTWEDLAAKAGYRAGALARLCGVSLRTVQRHFRQHYGLSVGEWLHGLRLNRAIESLRLGSRPKEVAYDLGFKQLSHFSRVFKQQFGFPPSRLDLSRHGRISARAAVSRPKTTNSGR